MRAAERHLRAKLGDLSTGFVSGLSIGKTELTATNSASVLALSAYGTRLRPQMEMS